ncbi:MAG: Na+/H+ antiporter NhaA [Bacteroidota bacterium]
MNTPKKKIATMLSETFKDFFQSSTAGGIVLVICTAVALVWANSPWSESYNSVWNTYISIGVGNAALSNTALHWINDGLMVIFFFFVGLEIKREVLVGELSSPKKALLPILAAIGGMVGPALIYLLFTSHDPELSRGWGIPMATDIAFALGILALLGDKIPAGLKVFLAALAIADDMGAIIVIALFYTNELSLLMLASSAGFLVLLVLANRFNVRSTAVYVLLGIGLWFCFLKSGVHATISGVLLALTIPVRSKIDKEQFLDEAASAIDELNENKRLKNENELIHHIAALSEEVQSPLHRFEHALYPYVAFLIMPVFAIANAGVKIEGSIVTALMSPVGLGVTLGLIIGKQVGILSFVWLSVKTKLAALPQNVSWLMIYGTTWLCAIGFTMALFIANLAFTQNEPLIISKVAILFASFIAAVVGLFLLSRLRRKEWN